MRTSSTTVYAVRAAVMLALYGRTCVAVADDPADTLQEIVVTAEHRRQDIDTVPYSISAIGSEMIRETGVVDLVSLSRQIPSFSLVDLGTRYESAEVPIIRGINASNIMQGPQQLAQSPVGVYIGNSPIGGFFELTDVERVEVLRGPQGTLYGAGALGGAVRVVPNAPELGVFSGSLGGNVGSLAHATDASYGLEGFVNVPLGDTVAFRGSIKYAYDPGFINAAGLVQRTGGPFSPPALANPSAPATSSAIYQPESRDWNFAKTVTGRASVLWKQNDFSAELSFTSAHVEGNAGPQDDPTFAGGPYGIDPRISFPAGADYQMYSAIEQPYWRTTNLTSLDLSYDIGFATLSSTSSYYDTGGITFDDDTYQVFAFTPYEVYYTGNPVNPRFVAVNEIADSDKTFSQEIRLVSQPNDSRILDYVAGLYFEKQDRHSDYDFAAPGTDTYSAAQGCTAPYYSGASFPNCRVSLGPNSTFFDEKVEQTFNDKSLFGEVTWHLTKSAQVVFGGRHYWQSFVATLSDISYPFDSASVGAPNKTNNSGNLFKINPSFEYAKDQMIYATWSQGFRRGGANSYITEGPLAESTQLLTYRPDTTDNYEFGTKGHIAGGIRYSLVVYDIEWNNPQIAGFTPYTDTPLVYNAKKARSTGIESELSGPLVLSGLRYDLSFGYTNARLTENFSLPANNGSGIISADEITGQTGERLPGSPKTSAAATVTYSQPITPQYSMVFSANLTYTGSVINGLPTVNSPQTSLPAYAIGNLSVTVKHQPYDLMLYATNVADKRAVLGVNNHPDPPIVGELANFDIINRPREVGLRVAFDF
jgi:iron complex outermembrane recepter protein